MVKEREGGKNGIVNKQEVDKSRLQPLLDNNLVFVAAILPRPSPVILLSSLVQKYPNNGQKKDRNSAYCSQSAFFA